MTEWIEIKGPAGSGKTTKLIELVGEDKLIYGGTECTRLPVLLYAAKEPVLGIDEMPSKDLPAWKELIRKWHPYVQTVYYVIHG